MEEEGPHHSSLCWHQCPQCKCPLAIELDKESFWAPMSIATYKTMFHSQKKNSKNAHTLSHTYTYVHTCTHS